MIPTVADVKLAALGFLDDDAGTRFSPTLQTWAFNLAYGTFIDCLLLNQVPHLERTALYTLPANIATLTPATASIADFGELDELEERLNGSAEKYTTVIERDELPQRDPLTILGDFAWQGGAFNFIGATTDRQLSIAYYASGTPPVSGTIGVDGSLQVLAKLTAAYLAPRKGDPELGATLMAEAVGERFRQGVMGGDAYRLIQPMVRGRLRVPLAPRPFRAGPSRVQLPNSRFFIGPASIIGSGTMVAITLTGAINGTTGSDGNATFIMNYAPTFLQLYKNGLLQTPGVSYAFIGSVVTFLAPNIPVAGNTLVAQGNV